MKKVQFITVGAVTGTLVEFTNDSLPKYQLIAESLKNDASVTEISQYLLDITGMTIIDPTSDIAFAFLEGSSGTGKTQMSFNILAALKGLRHAHYFLFTKPEYRSQNIYRNFSGISELFSNCVDADLVVLKGGNGIESKLVSCRSLFTSKLFTFGFVYHLLTSNTTDKVLIFPKSGEEIMALFQQIGIENSRPVFIIDECISKDDNRLRFVRNCFRAVFCGLLFLGTDLQAAMLVENISPESRVFANDWCKIFGTFPLVRTELLNLPQGVSNSIVNVLSRSRPLFAHKVAVGLQGTNDLDDVLRSVFNEICEEKNIFEVHHGKLGQLRLFNNKHYSYSPALIHSHFAKLVGPPNFMLKSSAKKNIWMPRSSFPSLEDDALLYLLFMGGNGFSAFYLGGLQSSLAQFYLSFAQERKTVENLILYSNAVQSSNDGMFLESFSCAAVCIASHLNGIKGMDIGQFLCNLVFQFQDQFPLGSISKLHLLQGVLNIQVPFLSPPNQEWPQFMYDIADANFGNLRRAENKDQIDLQISEEFVCESKDYAKPLDLPVLSDILEKIPEGAKLEIVFTRNLQMCYFTKRSFDHEFGKKKAGRMNYFKLDATIMNPSLEKINGLPSEKIDADGVVLFFIAPLNLEKYF